VVVTLAGMQSITWYQRLVSSILRVAEKWYLLAHGWEKVGDEKYSPPGDYPFRIKSDEYHRRHAVNAQHAVYGAQRFGS
jgi:hypothetical protein